MRLKTFGAGASLYVSYICRMPIAIDDPISTLTRTSCDRNGRTELFIVGCNNHRLITVRCCICSVFKSVLHATTACSFRLYHWSRDYYGVLSNPYTFGIGLLFCSSFTAWFKFNVSAAACSRQHHIKTSLKTMIAANANLVLVNVCF